jgi:hypothetical protein
MRMVGHSRIVALAELKAQVRMSDWITQPGQKLPVIVHNVAIMKGDDTALPQT